MTRKMFLLWVGALALSLHANNILAQSKITQAAGSSDDSNERASPQKVAPAPKPQATSDTGKKAKKEESGKSQK
jgi:hypothetical protein